MLLIVVIIVFKYFRVTFCRMINFDHLILFIIILHYCIYRIVDTLTRFLIWQFGEFSIGHQIKNSPIELTASVAV